MTMEKIPEIDCSLSNTSNNNEKSVINSNADGDNNCKSRNESYRSAAPGLLVNNKIKTSSNLRTAKEKLENVRKKLLECGAGSLGISPSSLAPPKETLSESSPVSLLSPTSASSRRERRGSASSMDSFMSQHSGLSTRSKRQRRNSMRQVEADAPKDEVTILSFANKTKNGLNKCCDFVKRIFTKAIWTTTRRIPILVCESEVLEEVCNSRIMSYNYYVSIIINWSDYLLNVWNIARTKEYYTLKLAFCFIYFLL